MYLFPGDSQGSIRDKSSGKLKLTPKKASNNSNDNCYMRVCVYVCRERVRERCGMSYVAKC